MIREVIREAWRQSPAGVIVAVLATPLVVFGLWVWLVVILSAQT